MCTAFATVWPSRLERPGIEPGAARGIIPAVDTIEAPQRPFNPRARLLLESAIPEKTGRRITAAAP